MGKRKSKTPTADITGDLLRRLQLRYRNGGDVLLRGVGNGAGYGNSGWSDAIAMSTWPSKGLRIYGFEVKATRSDWLRELDKPDKNAEWQEFCNEWYIVAPKGIVELSELPLSWGLMIPKGKEGLRIAKRSEREIKSEVVPLELMAAVFRAADSERIKEKNYERRRLTETIEAGFKEEIEQSENDAKEAIDELRELKRALGNSWDSIDKLKARAEAVAQADVSETLDTLDGMRNRLEVAARQMKEAHDSIAAQKPTGP